MANMWWEPVEFTVQVPGDWRVTIDTSTEPGIGAEPGAAVGATVTVGPRSIVVLER